MKILKFVLPYILPLILFSQEISENKIKYWDTQRKGANCFNRTVSSTWFTAAKEINIQFARIATDKWLCEKRDFLIGNADSFTEISQQDLKTLIDVLDQAELNNIKVVITFLSLPGSRWKQNNKNCDDLRIWKEKKYQNQAIAFWKTLASLLKNHPAIAGYNILNEPHPELLSDINDYTQINFQQWYESIQGSLADLNLFYKEVIKAIREADDSTPIIIDTGLYGTPWAISYLNPVDDDKIIYSFHMYEPYAYTTRKINNFRFSYPGSIPIRLEDIKKDVSNPDIISTKWDSAALEQFFQPIIEWQEKNHIPSSRILVGEFGCDRRSKGAERYLSDLIDFFNSRNWHWAFYSFREDCWDSMDYELGTGALPDDYWEDLEKGISPDKFRKDNFLFKAIEKNLQKEKHQITPAFSQ